MRKYKWPINFEHKFQAARDSWVVHCCLQNLLQKLSVYLMLNKCENTHSDFQSWKCNLKWRFLKNDWIGKNLKCWGKYIFMWCWNIINPSYWRAICQNLPSTKMHIPFDLAMPTWRNYWVGELVQGINHNTVRDIWKL